MNTNQFYFEQRIGFWQAIARFHDRFKSIDDAKYFFRRIFRTSKTTKTIRFIESAISQKQPQEEKKLILVRKRYENFYVHFGLEKNFASQLAHLAALSYPSGASEQQLMKSFEDFLGVVRYERPETANEPNFVKLYSRIKNFNLARENKLHERTA